MNISDYAGSAPWRFIFGKPETFPPESHRQDLSDFERSGALNYQIISFDPVLNIWVPRNQPYGNSGPNGPNGYQGPQGPQGYQGASGGSGPRGYQGYQGFAGLQGLIGAIGYQGFQGFIGIDGYQGARGAQGVQGYQGFQGFQGGIGSQGPQGDQGNQGNQGDRGYDGPNGPQGAQGPQGSSGPENCADQCFSWCTGFDYTYYDSSYFWQGYDDAEAWIPAHGGIPSACTDCNYNTNCVPGGCP